MSGAIRASSWRLMGALLAMVLAFAGVAVVVPASPAGAAPQCPRYTQEPCDDGSDPGDPTGPVGPPMEGGEPTVDMGDMVPSPAPNQPDRQCGNARFNQAVFALPQWRVAYTYVVNITICVTGGFVEVLVPFQSDPVPTLPADPRISYRNLGPDINQGQGTVTVGLEVTFCPTNFCQLYIQSVTFLLFPWGGQIRAVSDFRWIN